MCDKANPVGAHEGGLLVQIAEQCMPVMRWIETLVRMPIGQFVVARRSAERG